MATATYTYLGQSSSQRSVAMVLALVAAVVLSPLYMKQRTDNHYYNERRKTWNSSFYLPMVLGGLIIAIRTTSSSSQRSARAPVFSSLDSSSVFKLGSSSWGLAGVLIMLVLVLSWQDSVQGFFWR